MLDREKAEANEQAIDTTTTTATPKRKSAKEEKNTPTAKRGRVRTPKTRDPQEDKKRIKIGIPFSEGVTKFLNEEKPNQVAEGYANMFIKPRDLEKSIILDTLGDDCGDFVYGYNCFFSDDEPTDEELEDTTKFRKEVVQDERGNVIRTEYWRIEEADNIEVRKQIRKGRVMNFFYCITELVAEEFEKKPELREQLLKKIEALPNTIGTLLEEGVHADISLDYLYPIRLNYSLNKLARIYAEHMGDSYQRKGKRYREIIASAIRDAKKVNVPINFPCETRREKKFVTIPQPAFISGLPVTENSIKDFGSVAFPFYVSIGVILGTISKTKKGLQYYSVPKLLQRINSAGVDNEVFHILLNKLIKKQKDKGYEAREKRKAMVNANELPNKIEQTVRKILTVSEDFEKLLGGSTNSFYRKPDGGIRWGNVREHLEKDIPALIEKFGIITEGKVYEKSYTVVLSEAENWG